MRRDAAARVRGSAAKGFMERPAPARVDYGRAVECLFGETGSSVMEQLEDGPKRIAQVAEASGAGPDLLELIAPLLEAGVLRAESGTLSVDRKRLDEAIESDGARFDGVTDGLTKMDGYLN